MSEANGSRQPVEGSARDEWSFGEVAAVRVYPGHAHRIENSGWQGSAPSSETSGFIITPDNAGMTEHEDVVASPTSPTPDEARAYNVRAFPEDRATATAKKAPVPKKGRPPKLLKALDAFAFILPRNYREAVYEPWADELREDLIEAARLKGKWTVRWLSFCFRLRAVCGWLSFLWDVAGRKLWKIVRFVLRLPNDKYPTT